jgi:hypothetical protein
MQIDLNQLMSDAQVCANAPFFDGWLDESKRLTLAAPALVAEIERLRAALAKAQSPEWFYDADGDMNIALGCVAEVVEEVLEWGEPEDFHKPRLIEVATATPLPPIWVVARAYTEEEKTEREDDEPYEIHEFATQAEARAALQGQSND